MEEVEKGWLLGPLSNSEVPDWQPVSRRFGLIQKKGKLRLIDDYTESGVNACVTSVEAPVLHTVDVAGATLVMWFNACKVANISPELVVRTFDLKSAYRQVGLSKSGRNYACSRVFDPSAGRVKCAEAAYCRLVRCAACTHFCACQGRFGGWAQLDVS